jgi:hypothetical protein
MASQLFTERDAELAQACLNAPEQFNVTEPELRACGAVLTHYRDGRAINEDEAIIARRLLDIIARYSTADGE